MMLCSLLRATCTGALSHGCLVYMVLFLPVSLNIECMTPSDINYDNKSGPSPVPAPLVSLFYRNIFATAYLQEQHYLLMLTQEAHYRLASDDALPVCVGMLLAHAVVFFLVCRLLLLPKLYNNFYRIAVTYILYKSVCPALPDFQTCFHARFARIPPLDVHTLQYSNKTLPTSNLTTVGGCVLSQNSLHIITKLRCKLASISSTAQEYYTYVKECLWRSVSKFGIY